jgi:monoamine oxidase
LRPRAGASFVERGRTLISTLPLGVLQSAPPAGVCFAPELRAKQSALRGMAMGRVCKMVLLFREAFWREARVGRQGRRPLLGGELAFAHAFGRAVPTWWSSLPVLAPVLVGWAGGPAAGALLALDQDVRLRTALDAAAGILSLDRRACERQLAACYEHDWQADPCSRGAYAYVLAGGTSAPAALARPIARTLFFAGEATEPEQMGTVAGAVRSGERAAREVIGVLGAKPR